MNKMSINGNNPPFISTILQEIGRIKGSKVIK